MDRFTGCWNDGTCTAITNNRPLFNEISVVDAGTFGTVYRVRLVNTNRTAAVKQIPLTRFKSHWLHEVEVHKRLGWHPNVVQMLFYYISGSGSNLYLYVGMEYAPNNMHQMIRGYADIGLTMPTEYAKLYTYQMFRALGYMHALGLCHRDIKPRNLLVYPNWGVLKLCDFGSAKNLNDGRPNALYICSRHYRAPELLFGTRNYTVAVDIWSAGCVYAELILGRILYPGKTVAEQRNLVTRQLPKELIEIAPPDVVELVISTLSLKASLRPSAFESCAYRCYDQLRYGNILIPNDQPLPPLFNFNDTEVKAAGILIKELLPRQLL